MLKALRAGDADLVVSSRCIKAGSAESFSRGRVTGITGAVMGTIWNYSMLRTIVWKAK